MVTTLTRLVAPFGELDQATAGYYLCRISDLPPTATVRQVMRWLHETAADD